MIKLLKFAGVTALSALIIGCVTTEEIERQSFFYTCDGFGGIGNSGDGIGSLTLLRSPSPGALIRRLNIDPTAVQACTSAIDDLDTNYPKYWVRKASLLQSRALHRIDKGEFELGLADIQAAKDAVAENRNAYFHRSIGVNTYFIEALLLSKLGRQEEAEKLALATLRIRDHVPRAVSAAMVAVGPNATESTRRYLIDQLVRTNPNSIHFRLIYYFENQEFERVIAEEKNLIAPVLLEDAKRGIRQEYYQKEKQRSHSAEFWVDALGRVSYAHASLGNNDAAKATLLAAEERMNSYIIDDVSPPPQAMPDERTLSVVKEQVNLEIQTSVKELLDFWTTLVNVRSMINSGDTSGATNVVEKLTPKTSTNALFEILNELNIDSKDPTFREYQSNPEFLNDRLFGLSSQNAETMFKVLFEAESSSRMKGRFIEVPPSVPKPKAVLYALGECGGYDMDVRREIFCLESPAGTADTSLERILAKAGKNAKKRKAAGFRLLRVSMIHHSVVYVDTPTRNVSDLGFETTATVEYMEEGEDIQYCSDCYSTKKVISDLNRFYNP